MAQNFATLIVTRILNGAFASAVLNTPEVALADLWATEKEKDLPVILFVWFYFIGFTVGPAFGALFVPLSWRWFVKTLLRLLGLI